MNCSNYSVESEWAAENTIFVQSSKAAGRTRVATTASFVDYLNNHNVVVKDVSAGSATGELDITYTDGSVKTITVPA